MDPSPLAILATGVIAAVAVFAILHAVAVRFLHEVHVHDLRVEAHRLRRDYNKRLEALRRRAESGVEILSPGMAQDGEFGVDIIDDAAPARAA